MRRIAYMATFKGSAAPSNEAGTELKARTRAASVVPLDGSELPSGIAYEAEFESIVALGADGRFQERGSIDHGGGNVLHFSELSPGLMAPAPDGRSAGAIDWKVDSGTGVFAGASGYITSNFSVDQAGGVVDHQVASILLA